MLYVIYQSMFSTISTIITYPFFSMYSILTQPPGRIRRKPHYKRQKTIIPV
jgi:hypothetical protein